MIKSLTIEKIMEFTSSKFELEEYLPKYRNNRFPDRDWFWKLGWGLLNILNIVNTIVGCPFNGWINSKFYHREKAIVNKKRFWLKILPKFVEDFKKANHVSSKYFSIDTLLVAHGRSHFLWDNHAIKERN